jgi:hypothetical protein
MQKALSSFAGGIINTRGAMILLMALCVAWNTTAQAEQCLNAKEADSAQRAGLERAALQTFDWVTHGELAALRGEANTEIAANFSGLEAAVHINQPLLEGAQASIRATYLLDSTASSTVGTHAAQASEFLCGVWGSQQFVNFTFSSLPPGRYGLVITDVKTAHDAYYVSFIMQQESAGGPWKLAGLPTPASALALGHDAAWYLMQARAYKSQKQMYNAWFFYQEARRLAAPLPFMSTTPLIKLDREALQALPTDLPANHPANLAASNGRVYRLTQAFPVVVGNDLDLVVKYSSNDISNTAQTDQENTRVIQTMAQQHPELRAAFQAIVARAVDATGREYGTLLAMKDIPAGP